MIAGLTSHPVTEAEHVAELDLLDAARRAAARRDAPDYLKRAAAALAAAQKQT